MDGLWIVSRPPPWNIHMCLPSLSFQTQPTPTDSSKDAVLTLRAVRSRLRCWSLQGRVGGWET
eukprot:7390279-Prymnesium_polylepis.1